MKKENESHPDFVLLRSPLFTFRVFYSPFVVCPTFTTHLTSYSEGPFDEEAEVTVRPPRVLDSVNGRDE